MDPQRSIAFRSVPRTGVIYVTSEAQRHGYRPEDPDWCNLGQGQPETGELPGAPPRLDTVSFAGEDPDYAPIGGLPDLREAVASMYNRLFRRGMSSQYTADNVAISSGGRAGLTRAAASLGHVNLGHFLPDYTAYEELLEIFRAFTSIPILLEAEQAYDFSREQLHRELAGRGLSALLLSNPCNPTGKLIAGQELQQWVQTAGELDCSLLIDEFYSHYIWQDGAAPIESAARHVEHVDRDPVVIFDGLTKNWRYPGWRVAWTVGPRSVIDAVCSAGSFLDGGASRPMQRAAIPLLDLEHVEAETDAIRRCFAEKREFLARRLQQMGICIDRMPEGTFYVWGNLSELPEPLNDGMEFFRAALRQGVITVPGEFFDVNPGKRRRPRGMRFRGHVRFSFGPSLSVLRRACDRLQGLIEGARRSVAR